MDTLIGKTVSHYRIIEKIGQGGMGVVYKAEDSKLKRAVVLKFLPPYLTYDDEAIERFMYEARSASALDHQNVCTIHEIDEDDEGSLFICMGYYEGETLKEKMEQGTLPVEEAVAIARQIAQGLAKAHEKGIYHRDIKPSNLMITHEGVVKILDFGLVKVANTHITQTGKTMGTTAYMSPEQTAGKAVDQCTDIWSLGVVLYEMLTGQLPFGGAHEQAVIYAILNEEPSPLSTLRPEIPFALAQIVDKALAKEPAERYQSMQEFLSDLLSYKEGEAIIKPAKKATPRGKLQKRRQGLLYGIGAVVLLGMALIIGRTFTGSPMHTINGVAVLPFSIAGTDTDVEYLSDGITEGIIYSLSRLPDLKVIARSTVFRYKGQTVEPAFVANTLQVEAIVMGKVVPHKGGYLISAELINVADNSLVWGQQYQRKPDSLLSLQEEIVKEVALHLRPELSFAEFAPLAQRTTTSNEAYLLYLRGKFFLNQRTVEGFQKAIKYFQQAVDQDSDYALAYTGLADAYNLMGSYNILPIKESYPQAKAWATKALAVDERLAEAHTSLAAISQDAWDWTTAEQHFQRGVALNPNYAPARQWYAEFLTHMGRFEEGITQALKARDLDPLSFPPNNVVGANYYKARRYDEAIVALKGTVEMFPQVGIGYLYLALAYVQKGETAEAIAVFQEGRKLAPNTIELSALLTYTYAKADRSDEAKQLFNEVIELSRERYVPAIIMATMYVGFNDHDQAFAWLEKAYEDRNWQLTFLGVEPVFDPIRNDPRFIKLLDKIGISNTNIDA